MRKHVEERERRERIRENARNVVMTIARTTSPGILGHVRRGREKEESGERCGPVGPRRRKNRGLVCTVPSGADVRTVGR